MVLELIGGPLDGVIHELPMIRGLETCPMPAQFALPNEEKTERHWYKTNLVDRKTANYLFTEQIEVDNFGRG